MADKDFNLKAVACVTATSLLERFGEQGRFSYLEFCERVPDGHRQKHAEEVLEFLQNKKVVISCGLHLVLGPMAVCWLETHEADQKSRHADWD